MYKRLAIGLSLSLLLTGCGFYLQTSDSVPSSLKTLYLTGSKPYDPFMALLRSSLTHRGVKLVDFQKQAPFTLNVSNISLATSLTSLSTSQQTRQYSVSYSTTFNLESPKGNNISGPYTLSNSQTLTMFSGQLIDNTNQLATAKRELERETINQLFYHLNSDDTKLAIKEYQAKQRLR